MAKHSLISRRWAFVVALAMIVVAARAFAADAPAAAPAGAASATDGSASATAGVDFFAAIQDGDLDVKFIARNSRKAQVVIKNTTDQPLTVKLPEAFAAIPVLAQQAGAAGAGNRSTTTGNNNKNQGLGGGMGGYGGGMGGGGGGFGGAASLAPDKTVKIQLDVVCLDYGKPDPSPYVSYTIVPAEKYITDPKVKEVCKMLGDGKVDQRTAQIAAWHLANHLTWDELAGLKTFPHLPQYSQPVFSTDEITEAVQIVDQAIKAVDAGQKQPATATTTPSSASSN
jgi:hypothetical protein